MNAFNAMLARFQPLVLSIFRIVTGLLLFQYGVAKVLKFPVVPPFDKVAPFSLFWCAGTIELVLGGLLILGLLLADRRPSSCRAKWRSPISSGIFRAAFFR